MVEFGADRVVVCVWVHSLLALPCRVVLHHFEPLLHSLRVPLIHAVLAVVAQFQTEGQIPDVRAQTYTPWGVWLWLWCVCVLLIRRP